MRQIFDDRWSILLISKLLFLAIGSFIHLCQKSVNSLEKTKMYHLKSNYASNTFSLFWPYIFILLHVRFYCSKNLTYGKTRSNFNFQEAYLFFFVSSPLWLLGCSSLAMNHIGNHTYWGWLFIFFPHYILQGVIS
jgi:hypothetical protein